MTSISGRHNSSRGFPQFGAKVSLKLRLAIQFGAPVNHLKNRFLIGTPRYEQNVWPFLPSQLSHLLPSCRFPRYSFRRWGFHQRGLLYLLMFIWNSVYSFFFSPRKRRREYVGLIISTRDNNSHSQGVYFWEMILARNVTTVSCFFGNKENLYLQCLHNTKASLKREKRMETFLCPMEKWFKSPLNNAKSIITFYNLIIILKPSRTKNYYTFYHQTKHSAV